MTEGRTSGKQPRIDVVIAGFHKCATTSLWQTAATHPEVATHHTGQVFGPYAESLRSGEPLDCLTELRRQYDPQKTVVVRDTTLFDDPIRVEALRRDNPRLKLIFGVRDPIERAFSAFQHALSKGFEHDYPTFEAAVSALVAGTFEARDPPLLNYFEQGLYSRYISIQSSIVGAENILLVDSERLRSDFSSESVRVFEFMGVTPIEMKPVFANVRSAVRSRALSRFVRGDSALKSIARRTLSARFRKNALSLFADANRRPVRIADQMSANSREILVDYYADASETHASAGLSHQAGILQ